jgi:hypothetical protein
MGQRHESKGLGCPKFVSQIGRKGPGPSIDGAVATEHDRWMPEGCHGIHQSPGQLALVTGQLAHIAVAVSFIAQGEPDHLDTESCDLAQDRLDRGRSCGQDHDPAVPSLSQAQGVF